MVCYFACVNCKKPRIIIVIDLRKYKNGLLLIIPVRGILHFDKGPVSTVQSH